MERVVLFDGVCNFCNASVNFIIRHDHDGRFKFAPLQSEYGRQMRERFRIADDVDGAPVFMAKSAWELRYSAEKWPKIKFTATRERRH